MTDQPKPIELESSADAGGALGRLLAAFARRQQSAGLPAIFGMTVSMFLHVALALAVALLFIEPPILGDGTGGPRTEVTISAQTELSEMGGAPLGSAALSLEPAKADFGGMTTIPSAGDSLPRLTVGDVDSVGSGSGGAAHSDSESELADGLGGLGGGGGGTAKFFGIEARGTRFAYIVDTSGSMAGERLSALQDELTRSVAALPESASVSIILFNSSALPLTGTDWVPASEKNRREALVAIRGISAGGATNPLPAFQAIEAFKPRADGIYFMTDGVFEASIAEQLVALIDRASRGGGKRTQLHCITFVERDSEKLMRRLARLTGGTYTHVEGPKKP